MVKFPSALLIISLITNRCRGQVLSSIKWTPELNRQLLDIFYGTLPSKEGHLQRLKEEWDKKLPQYKNENAKRIRKRGYVLINRHLEQWKRRPIAEEEKMEALLSGIYAATDNNEPNHEKRMLDKLIQDYPQYRKEFEMMRAVVHNWYQRHAPRKGKELRQDQVNWTPQLKADLMHITDRVLNVRGKLQDKIRSRWLQMHGDLNVGGGSLLAYSRKLRWMKHEPSVEEKNEAKRKYDMMFPLERNESEGQKIRWRGEKVLWTDQQNADILYIHKLNSHGKRVLGKKVQEQWSKIYNELSHLTAKNLCSHVYVLKKNGFKPTEEQIRRAKYKYENLPPTPPRQSKTETSNHTLSKDLSYRSPYRDGGTSTPLKTQHNEIQEYPENELPFSPLPFNDFHSMPDDYTHQQLSDFRKLY